MSVNAQRGKGLEGTAATFWMRTRSWRSARRALSSVARAENARKKQLAAFRFQADAITSLGQECRIEGVCPKGVTEALNPLDPETLTLEKTKAL